MTYLEINNVSKTYKGAKSKCIDNLSLQIEKGEIVVILGPSGCGKTTLLKMIAGLEKIDSGDITIDGKVMNEIEPNKRPIAMVFQKALLLKNLDVEDNINISPRVNHTMPSDEMHAKVLELLKTVELEGFENRKVTELSGGQEQRVSIARALITEPKVLLLDEPFSALDAQLRVTLRKSLRDICKSLNQTVLFVTHDQQEAVAIADKIALMMDGKFLQFSTPDDYYHHPISKESALFFGWKNAIPAEQEGNEITSIFGKHITRAEPQTGKIYLMMHPQAAMCSLSGMYEAKVLSASNFGTFSSYIVDFNGTRLEIHVSCRNSHLVDDTIRFNVDQNMMWPVPFDNDNEQQPVNDSQNKSKKRKLSVNLTPYLKKISNSINDSTYKAKKK